MGFDTNERNYALLVHRNHARRVQSSMECGRGHISWTKLECCGEAAGVAAANASKFCDGIGDCVDTSQTTVVETPYEKGRRKSRRGYVLLVICNAQFSPVDLPVVARQHISWAAKLEKRTGIYNTSVRSTEKAASGSVELLLMVRHVATQVYQELKARNFDLIETASKRANELRLDIHPSSLTLCLCQELQRVASHDGVPSRHDTDALDEFDGPIRMTRSLQKCSFVLNAVFDSDEDVPPTRCYWGIATRSEQGSIVTSLNNNAKPWIEGFHHSNALAPTSRAFYKLDQIFDEYITEISLAYRHTSALDLGSSPGGWTQVLHQNGLRPVLSIDQGLLAPRVLALDEVVHVQDDFSSQKSSEAIASAAPYSAIVCDANIFLELFGRINEIVEKVSKILIDRASASRSTSLLAFPSIVVITLKLPYKTEESMRRNLAWALSRVQPCLQRIVNAAAATEKEVATESVSVKYTVSHLHANSESERTLIAVFDRKTNRNNELKLRR